MTCDHSAFVLLDPSNDMFFPNERRVLCKCWGLLHFPHATYSTLSDLSESISQQASGGASGVGLWWLRQVSRYCFVNAFLQLEGKAYASVTWLSTPTYPCAPFKLVVKVRMLTPQQQRSHRSVIPVDRIDPCTVAVLPHNDGVHFYMIRDKGTDRTTTA